MYHNVLPLSGVGRIWGGVSEDESSSPNTPPLPQQILPFHIEHQNEF